MRNEKEIKVLKEELRKCEVVELEKKIKSLQSMKCRLRKMDNNVDKMNDILEEERIYREVVNEKKERKLFIYERNEDDIFSMSYEEVMKGIKNCDSIKCLELSKNEEFMDNDKLVKVEKIREWLIERKKEVSKLDAGLIRISDVINMLDMVSSLKDLKEWLLNKED